MNPSGNMSKIMGELRSLVGNKPTTRLFIAASGGVDSCVLMRAAHLCNINYMAIQVVYKFRPESETKLDIKAVYDELVLQGKKFNHIIRYSPATPEGNHEEWARDFRYQQFKEMANGQPIATAHTADDQLETLIFRICRGTGLNGLSCIARKHANVIRPMLNITKDEVYEIARHYGIGYHEDITNDDMKYRRNFIRKKIVPLLKELNPQVARHATKLCGIAQEFKELL